MVFIAKARAYDILQELEQAQKQIALAEAARDAALRAIAESRGLSGEITYENGKLIGG